MPPNQTTAHLTELPRLAPQLEFLGPDELDRRPFVAVDGAPPHGAALALAHWPGSGTPAELGAPTATEIAWRYLHVAHRGAELVEVVTNNHVDEDGLLSAWVLTNRPGTADAQIAIATATAGDFAVWDDDWIARRTIALEAAAEPATTPFWAVTRALSARTRANPSGPIHRALLPKIASILSAPDRYEYLWRARWQRVLADIDLLDAGVATLIDAPDADAVLVRTPRPLDELAVHPRTDRGVVVTSLPDGRVTAVQRYESWVEFAPEGTRERISLVPVAAELSALDPGAQWRGDGPEIARAKLSATDAMGNAVPAGLDAAVVIEALARARQAAPGGGPRLL